MADDLWKALRVTRGRLLIRSAWTWTMLGAPIAALSIAPGEGEPVASLGTVAALLTAPAVAAAMSWGITVGLPLRGAYFGGTVLWGAAWGGLALAMPAAPAAMRCAIAIAPWGLAMLARSHVLAWCLIDAFPRCQSLLAPVDERLWRPRPLPLPLLKRVRPRTRPPETGPLSADWELLGLAPTREAAALEAAYERAKAGLLARRRAVGIQAFLDEARAIANAYDRALTWSRAAAPATAAPPNGYQLFQRATRLENPQNQLLAVRLMIYQQPAMLGAIGRSHPQLLAEALDLEAPDLRRVFPFLPAVQPQATTSPPSEAEPVPTSASVPPPSTGLGEQELQEEVVTKILAIGIGGVVLVLIGLPLYWAISRSSAPQPVVTAPPEVPVAWETPSPEPTLEPSETPATDPPTVADEVPMGVTPDEVALYLGERGFTMYTKSSFVPFDEGQGVLFSRKTPEGYSENVVVYFSALDAPRSLSAQFEPPMVTLRAFYAREVDEQNQAEEARAKAFAGDDLITLSGSFDEPRLIAEEGYAISSEGDVTEGTQRTFITNPRGERYEITDSLPFISACYLSRSLTRLALVGSAGGNSGQLLAAYFRFEGGQYVPDAASPMHQEAGE